MAISSEEAKTFVKKVRAKYKVYPPKFIFLQTFLKKVSTTDLSKLEKISINNDDSTNDWLIQLQKVLYNTNIDYLYDSFRECIDFVPVVLNKNAEEDILAIDKEVISLGFDGTYIVFSMNVVTYDPHNNTSFDFGNFVFTMASEQVKMVPSGNNKSNGMIYHPYLSRYSILCLGEYKDAYIKAIKDLRYYDAFTIINTVTKIYGGDNRAGHSDGPHGVFTGWSGDRCLLCDELHPLDDFVLCAITKRRICKKCASKLNLKDEKSGKYYCPEYIDFCETCKKYKYDVKGNNCIDCRKSNLSGVI